MQRTGRQHEHGFTLVELLVVMSIIGVLAAIALPAFLSNKSKAQEATVKSDVKQIAKEVVGYYVDGTGPLTLRNTTDGRSWQVVDAAAAVVAEGPLSSRNAVLTSGVITSSDTYCVAIRPDRADARSWRADPDGLSAGTC